MNSEEEKIERQLEKFGELVRSAAKKNHKMTARQIEFFTNAIREQGQQERPQNRDDFQAGEQSSTHEKTVTKTSTQGKQQSNEHGDSH